MKVSTAEPRILLKSRPDLDLSTTAPLPEQSLCLHKDAFQEPAQYHARSMRASEHTTTWLHQTCV